jgi:hypothetical protein
LLDPAFPFWRERGLTPPGMRFYPQPEDVTERLKWAIRSLAQAHEARSLGDMHNFRYSLASIDSSLQSALQFRNEITARNASLREVRELLR